MANIRNIVIIMTPARNPELTQFSGLIRLTTILSAVAENIFIITGNFPVVLDLANVTVINVRSQKTGKSKESLLSGIVRVLMAQLTLSFALIKRAPKFMTGNDRVVIFRPVTILLPVLLAVILGMKIITVLTGHSENVWKLRKDIFARLLIFIKKINLKLAYRIVVYHDSLIKEWNLENYLEKILIAPYLYIDFRDFKIIKPLASRENVIGYVGRLDHEKGIMNFIEAISALHSERDDIRVVIIGDGELMNEVKQYIKEKKLDNVQLNGWVAHNDMPDHLNQFKLMVIPSYTEGLPNVLIEAMACGTPVLATQVGAIPYIVIHEQTGFILDDNLPESINKQIVAALNYPQLDTVVANAYSLIESGFSYSAVVKKYKELL